MEINQDNFNEKVLKSSKPTVVDFYAEWCGPCKAIMPLINGLVQEYEGKVNIIKIDVDSNPNLAIQYDIRSVPTLMFFKDGNLVNTIKGSAPKNKLQESINAML